MRRVVWVVLGRLRLTVAAQAGLCCLGGLCLVPVLRRPSFPSGSFLRCPSARIAAISQLPRPTGIPTARAFYSGGSISGQSLEVSLSFLLVSLSILSLPGLPQLGPRALAAFSPFQHPTGPPNPDKGHFYSVDSFIRQFIARQYSYPTTLTWK